MEQLMAGLGVSMAAFEEMSVLAQEIREGEAPDRWVGPFLFEGSLIRKAREFSRKMGHLERDSFCEFVIRNRAQEQAANDREIAAQIGIYLRGREDLVEIVRGDSGCQLWSVAEWLCEESMTSIHRLPKRAAECAEAALAVAELAPGEEPFRIRLKGYCWGHVGNIHRAANEYKVSDLAFGRYAELWAAGRDPHGLLDAGRVMGLEASLRKDQGRLTEAMRLLREALPVATRREQPYLRLNYGTVLEYMGDSESAICVLKQAAEQAPKHLLFYARFNVAVNLCHLGRYEEAQDLFPEVARLALESESKDNRVRVRWLSYKIGAEPP